MRTTNTNNNRPLKPSPRLPYALLIGAFSIPVALVVLQVGFELVRIIFQRNSTSWFAGLGEGLWVLFGVIFASALINALALWSAKSDPGTPYSQAAIVTCSISLALSLYPILATALGLQMFNPVLWAPSS